MPQLKASYYTQELHKIQTNSDYAPTLQIKDANGNATKWMSLNQESAQNLIDWLKLNILKGE